LVVDYVPEQQSDTVRKAIPVHHSIYVARSTHLYPVTGVILPGRDQIRGYQLWGDFLGRYEKFEIMHALKIIAGIG